MPCLNLEQKAERQNLIFIKILSHKTKLQKISPAILKPQRNAGVLYLKKISVRMKAKYSAL